MVAYYNEIDPFAAQPLGEQTIDSYAEFLQAKAVIDPPTGLVKLPTLHPGLFDFQRDIVGWALRRGRAAIFADCGMGKTAMQLEWARHTPDRVLILTPLAVAPQTVAEAAKFNIESVGYARSQAQADTRIVVTNYEMLEHFDPKQFSAIVLDESSILKSYDGKTRTQIVEAFAHTPYRLACTATPAPNDYMELGNHAEFLGTMSRAEMLAMFFVHDGGETQKWRLKGHAESEFWHWLCSWAVMIRKPSDLGYEDGAFTLPELVMHEHAVDSATTEPAKTLQERIAARRESVAERVAEAERIVKGSWTTKNRSSQSAGSGITRTPSENEREAAPSPQPTENRSSRRKGNTSPPTESNAARICASDIDGSALSSSQSSASTAQNTDTSNTTVTCVGSTASPSRTTKPYSENRAAGAQSAESEESACRLTTATPAALSEESSAPVAIRASADSKTVPIGCDGLPATSMPQWIIWTNLNAEADAIARAIPGAVNIQGSDTRERKEAAIRAFLDGRIRVLVSKVSIFGFGLNLQCCQNMIFLGLSDSYESFYQALRRVWRFGQQKIVNVHVITAKAEGAVVDNIKRKEADAMNMAVNMVEHMKDLSAEDIRGTNRQKATYEREIAASDQWTLHLADCVDVAKELPDNSLHYSIYSPPFASLYTYSNSDRDMGNCKDSDEFMEHYGFLVREMYRATMPGRLVSFHCMNLPTSKIRHGYIGLRDFRGELIRLHEEAGWIFHSEVVIWKNPVTAMQRTKALGLLWKQLKKDSAMSRQGIPDYVVTMRKPGENTERVSHTPEGFPVAVWQNYASPVWMDINPSDTLQYRSARAHDDERHICPLQLDVIRRAVRLWSNPGDVVFSPFAGIGSEGHVALEMGRRFLGVELKRSYWEQAHKNLRSLDLF